jgi:hypothetical protein
MYVYWLLPRGQWTTPFDSARPLTALNPTTRACRMQHGSSAAWLTGKRCMRVLCLYGK